MKVKPAVLYLSYDGLTDSLGRSQILPYLLRLTKDYDITIVSFEKPNSKGDKEIRELILQKLDWVPLRYTKWPPIVSTIFDLFNLFFQCRKLIDKRKFEIVHCRSYITSIVGVHLKIKYKLRFIFDMRGFWVDERVEGGIWNLSNPIFRLVYFYFKKKEKHIISIADHIVTLTLKSKLIIKDRFKVEEATISVIPCCVDVDFFNPDRIDCDHVSELKKMLGINSDTLVLLYLGSLGTWYMLDEMLIFFKYLLSIKPKSKFLIVTPHSKEEIIKSACAHEIVPESLIVRSADRRSVPVYISLADISILFIKPSFSKLASSPTKLGEVLSMGIPVVANGGIGDIDSLFRENNCGIVIESFQKKIIEEAVQKIDVLLTLDKVGLRSVAKANFSLESGVQKYAMIYSGLLH
jgi:glycosyltransferase involved in cell wall biosynthesis